MDSTYGRYRPGERQIPGVMVVRLRIDEFGKSGFDAFARSCGPYLPRLSRRRISARTTSADAEAASTSGIRGETRVCMARDASGHRPKRDNRPDFGANPSSIQRLLVNVPLPKMKLLPSGARLNRIDGVRLLPG